VCDEIAAGGTATVHFGRLLGQGFARTVAIKRLHPAYARDPQFTGMFLDEARIAARIRHPNVCSILDVVTVDDVPCLVLDYVHGEPLAKLIHAAVQKGETVPYDVAAGIVCGMLHGLHEAHEATDEQGEPLHIIHRDVSPQNVLVGTDGVPRVVDFGLAKAVGRLQNTAEGQLKGKLGYMAPEQFALAEIDRRVDIYSAAVVLWESMTGEFLFDRSAPSSLMHQILEGEVRPPSAVAPDIPAELDEVCMRGLSRNPSARFETAHDMAVAIESAVVLPSPHEIGAWVERVAGDVLRERARVLARIEAEHPSAPSLPPPPIQSSPQPGRGRVPLSIGIASIVVVVVLLLAFWPPAGPAVSETPAGAAILPDASAPVAPPPELPATMTPNAPADVPGDASADVSADVSVDVAPDASTVAPAGDSRRRRPDCSPPYTVDSEGIRRPKRECLSLSR
jgi:serine/threonine-protein kinase